MLSPDEQREFFNDLIVVRHSQLDHLRRTFSHQADLSGRAGNSIRVALIFLGALTVSQSVAVKVFDQSSAGVAIFYAVVGILIAALSGMEAAFKFEAKANELRNLAVKCQNARLVHNSEWAQKFVIAEPETALDAARDLLAMQDKALAEIQSEGAKLGVNVGKELAPSWLEAGSDKPEYGDLSIVDTLLTDAPVGRGRTDQRVRNDLPPPSR